MVTESTTLPSAPQPLPFFSQMFLKNASKIQFAWKKFYMFSISRRAQSRVKVKKQGSHKKLLYKNIGTFTAALIFSVKGSLLLPWLTKMGSRWLFSSRPKFWARSWRRASRRHCRLLPTASLLLLQLTSGEFFGIALAAAFSRILCSSLILKDVGDYMTGEKGRKKKKKWKWFLSFRPEKSKKWL